jgi:tetratricopeptide (TPR) repeat protein
LKKRKQRLSHPQFPPGLSPIGPDQVFQHAMVCHMQGRLAAAERGYRRVLKTNDRHFGALYHLGLLRLQQHRFDDAVRQFRRAVNVERNSAEAHHHLAIALMATGRMEEAIACYNRTIAIRPDVAETHNNLGHALETLGKADAAIAHYEKALVIKPSYAEAHNNFGNALHKLGRPEEAVAHYKKALAIKPQFAEAHDNLGIVLAALGRYEEAITCHEKALAISPNDAEAHDHLGTTLHLLSRSQEAVAHHERAIAIRPNEGGFHNSLGNALNAMGRLQEATAAYGKAVALTPGKVRYLWNLTNVKRFTTGDPDFTAMQRLAQHITSLPVEEQIELHFALGKALGDVGDGDRAFDHILLGNSLKRQQIHYAEAETLARLERIQQVFSADLLREKSGFGNPSTLPIFIVGLPRSGTTLVEQILASHPKVFGAGELGEIGRLVGLVEMSSGNAYPEAAAEISGEQLRQLGADYVHAIRRLAPTAERITDKMPANYLYAGLIHLAFPKARIIHTCRDLRDTALSCFSTLWPLGQDHTYELAELGRYCRSYRTLMDHWRNVLPKHVMLEIQYEDLVAGPKEQTKRILDHCGLEWDGACLAFYRTERAVLTASASQVRQPIYTTSVGRWRAFESRLQQLLQALGMKPSHVAPTPGSLV